MLPICVVRQGNVFGPEYIELMQNQLGERPIQISDNFPSIPLIGPSFLPGMGCVTLQTGLSGWWAKMELFAPWNEHLRPFLFLDLDTYVVGDISEIRSDPGDRLLMLRDFNRTERPASGVMVVPKDTGHIWDAWQKNPDTSIQGGDQTFIGRFCDGFLQDMFPNQIYSYKLHCRDRPKGSIVCFHGKPKPHELGPSDGWAYRFWTERTGYRAADGNLEAHQAL